jgi:hypothetical protein
MHVLNVGYAVELEAEFEAVKPGKFEPELG